MMIRLSKDVINYPDALDVMNDHVVRRDEFIWLLRHQPVFTKGVRSNMISDLPHPYYMVNRGGQWTFHDPGQLIIYYVLDLKKRQWTFSDFLDYIQKFGCFFLNTLSIQCINGPQPGFWATHQGKIKKIGSLGVQVKNGMTLHGIAINHTIDQNALSHITPCGLDHSIISSLEELGYSHSMDDLMKDAYRKISKHALDFLS